MQIVTKDKILDANDTYSNCFLVPESGKRVSGKGSWFYEPRNLDVAEALLEGENSIVIHGPVDADTPGRLIFMVQEDIQLKVFFIAREGQHFRLDEVIKVTFSRTAEGFLMDFTEYPEFEKIDSFGWSVIQLHHT